MLNKKTIKTIVFLAFLALTLQVSAQEGVVMIDQDSDIETLLEYKKDIRTVDLYKIQVYSGTRSGAENTRRHFLNAYGEWPVNMEFDSPNTKIWVGNFRSRLEADKALLKIKRKYANAFIFKPKKDKKK
ncbi:SPOR domain-containing protein [Ichthyenterobacterium magnum]|uniref:Sporulation related protein n=1 Tax=Ichthyenterobacterium magnum TaxID=1230530 RepID=A0A420DXW8_9FLAO|nr:SPOR domain-containing protein [Ichthyenterobacterium magnum]RKE99074.1 sporulation related protein [Ichthyenterobacterium magnum]